MTNGERSCKEGGIRGKGSGGVRGREEHGSEVDDGRGKRKILRCGGRRRRIPSTKNKRVRRRDKNWKEEGGNGGDCGVE